MSRTSRRPRRHRKKQSVWPPAIGIATLLALIAGVMVALDPDEIDPATFCPTGGAAHVTSVIIDTSDPLAPHQTAALRKFAASLITAPEGSDSPSHHYVRRGHLLVAYEIADGSNTPNLLFRSCSPGDPKSRTVEKKLTEGEKLALLRWEKFTRDLTNAFPNKPATKPASPIIETVRYVRRAEYPGSSKLKTSGQRAGAIFIVSDMLQNSDKLSHFAAVLPPAADAPASFALDLSGIDIGIRYLKMDQYDAFQTKEHFAWWRQFFAAAGSPLRLSPEVW